MLYIPKRLKSKNGDIAQHNFINDSANAIVFDFAYEAVYC